MSVLKDAFDAGKFAVTAEMAPPKGCDFSHQLEDAQLLKGKVHGINVTDMQSACLKASSIGLCAALKAEGLNPIIQMTGRDRSRMAIMGDFLSAAALGIDTMLALTGDHTVVGDCKDSKPVFDLDSCGILKMLSEMESTNKDCGGNDLEGEAPVFYKGACVTPVYEPQIMQIAKLKRRLTAARSIYRHRAYLTSTPEEIYGCCRKSQHKRTHHGRNNSSQGCRHGKVHERKRSGYRCSGLYDRASR